MSCWLLLNFSSLSIIKKSSNKQLFRSKEVPGSVLTGVTWSACTAVTKYTRLDSLKIEIYFLMFYKQEIQKKGNFLRSHSILFAIMAVPISIPTIRVSFSPHPCKHLCLFEISHPHRSSVISWWFLFAFCWRLVMLNISLYLLAICTLSLGKRLFRTFAYF